MRMRGLGAREEDNMADNREVPLDRAQVKKAVLALRAFLNSASSGEALFADPPPLSLLFTLWRIPGRAQSVRIVLPHSQRTDGEDVCLFTKDEPNMTPEQNQRFCRKLLEERGVTNVSEIIPFRTLKTEYKPYEAKRRLLGNFDVFLCDERIRRLLPSHLGKHFYERKRMPQSVNMQSKHLAKDVQRIVQGTSLTVTNKGCCWLKKPDVVNLDVDNVRSERMARVAHAGMDADQVVENVEAAVRTVVAKLQMKGPLVKVIHLKSPTSVALPIYTSDLSHLSAAKTKEASSKKKLKNKTDDEKQKQATMEEEEEEDIPQLVTIETTIKKAKLEKPSRKKPMQKTIKTASNGKRKTAPGARRKTVPGARRKTVPGARRRTSLKAK